jgi:putative addiction module killer protein
MIALREYLGAGGENQYRAWFMGLDVAAATKVAVALERMAQGNKSSIKGVGEGVLEYRIDFGPGYRIYLGKDGEQLIILLGGGTKKRQNEDIESAKAAWREYKQRKKAAQKFMAPKTSATTKPMKPKHKRKRKAEE